MVCACYDASHNTWCAEPGGPATVAPRWWPSLANLEWWMNCKKWIEIDGVDGVEGVDGVDGIDGIDGVDGIDGIDGIDAIDGIDGINSIITEMV